jgi:hypothetical protein
MTTETSQAEIAWIKVKGQRTNWLKLLKLKSKNKDMNDNRIIQETQDKWEQNKTDWEKDDWTNNRNNPKEQQL